MVRCPIFSKISTFVMMVLPTAGFMFKFYKSLLAWELYSVP
jgi:hypothetical protein